MSTPTLSARHFASVGKSLLYYANFERSPQSASMISGEVFRSFGLHPFESEDGVIDLAIDTLVFDLARINAKAHARRYNKRESGVAWAKSGELLSLPALVKALHCIRYNCDGDQTLGALERLGKVIEAITDHIISGLPEYDKAEWFL